MPEERWGNIHPSKPWMWYDPDSVFIEGSGVSLYARRNPKRFSKEYLIGINPALEKEIPEDGVFSEYGIGLLSCTERFTYGKFEVVAELPKVARTWPAIWMWGWESWPPEIDLMEGYSTLRRPWLFGKKQLYWDLVNNVHWTSGRFDSQKFAGGFSVGEGYHSYGCNWQPDKIEYFFDGRKTREIKKEISGEMNFILNLGVEKDYSYFGDSKFRVLDFTYRGGIV